MWGAWAGKKEDCIVPPDIVGEVVTESMRLNKVTWNEYKLAVAELDDRRGSGKGGMDTNYLWNKEETVYCSKARKITRKWVLSLTEWVKRTGKVTRCNERAYEKSTEWSTAWIKSGGALYWRNKHGRKRIITFNPWTEARWRCTIMENRHRTEERSTTHTTWRTVWSRGTATT